MELVGILRLLWRFRALVVAVALVAILVGMALTYRIGLPPKLESRQYEVGLASAEALVDTPSSQVVDLGAQTGSDITTLAGRATLLASLLTSSPIKDEVARRAGVDPRELIAVPPSGAAPGAPGPGRVSGGAVSLTDPRANILRATVPTLESGDVPIIAISTQAPEAVVAAKLADESVAVLKQRLESVAGADKVPSDRRLVVDELGPARSTVERRGPQPFMAVIAALFVFFLGCAAIVGTFALVSAWREASVMDVFDDAAWDDEEQSADVEPFDVHLWEESPTDQEPSGSSDVPAEQRQRDAARG
jgi:capsular polysaccharide biosynthesis protein